MDWHGFLLDAVRTVDVVVLWYFLGLNSAYAVLIGLSVPEMFRQWQEATNEDLNVDADGDLLDGVPVKSRLAWLFAYRFPVHRISESFRPQEPGEQPTFLVIFRNPDDDLGFMELNPVTARLLELIADNEDKTGRQLLEILAEEISYTDVDALVQHGDAE